MYIGVTSVKVKISNYLWPLTKEIHSSVTSFVYVFIQICCKVSLRKHINSKFLHALYILKKKQQYFGGANNLLFNVLLILVDAQETSSFFFLLVLWNGNILKAPLNLIYLYKKSWVPPPLKKESTNKQTMQYKTENNNILIYNHLLWTIVKFMIDKKYQCFSPISLGLR